MVDERRRGGFVLGFLRVAENIPEKKIVKKCRNVLYYQ
jgi:hypothetical protein